MRSEQNRIDPVARITEKRLNRAASILKEGAQYERPPAQERLVELAQDLDRLLGEIESFSKIVYCQNPGIHAAACLLGQLGTNDVLRVLAGSVTWKRKLSKDHFYHAPSPAATFVLGNSVNGREAWKDWRGRSINSMSKTAQGPQ